MKITPSTQPYVCIDCGCTVTRILAAFYESERQNRQDGLLLCMECLVIRDAPAEDRAALRKAFHK